MDLFIHLCTHVFIDAFNSFTIADISLCSCTCMLNKELAVSESDGVGVVAAGVSHVPHQCRGARHRPRLAGDTPVELATVERVRVHHERLVAAWERL